MNDGIRERPIDSVTNVVFWSVLSAVRNTRDPNAVYAVVSELSAEYGRVLVSAVLEAVENRINEERLTIEAVRVIPPWPADVNESHGHA